MRFSYTTWAYGRDLLTQLIGLQEDGKELLKG